MATGLVWFLLCFCDTCLAGHITSSYTLYHIRVVIMGERCGLTAPKEFCSVKRYSDFHSFNAEVRTLQGQGDEHGGFKSTELPPKRVWPMRASVVQERRRGLACFLMAFEKSGAVLPRQLLLDFLLPETQPDLALRVPTLKPRTRHRVRNE